MDEAMSALISKALLLLSIDGTLHIKDNRMKLANIALPKPI